MRSKSLLGLLGLLGVCGSVLAEPGEGRSVASEKSSVSRDVVGVTGPGTDLAAQGDEPGFPAETVIYDVDQSIPFKRVVVGPDGIVREKSEGDDEGAVAGPSERLIYENTLGINAINFPIDLPVSDDIATTAPDN